MRKLNRKFGIHAKQYKDFFYTIEQLDNTQYGNPNYEVVIYSNVNGRFDVLGEVYHVSTYANIFKYVEEFIDNLINK
jgi:hypothetical protein